MTGPKLDTRGVLIVFLGAVAALLTLNLMAQQRQSPSYSEAGASAEVAVATREVATAVNRVADSLDRVASAVAGIRINVNTGSAARGDSGSSDDGGNSSSGSSGGGMEGTFKLGGN